MVENCFSMVSDDVIAYMMCNMHHRAVLKNFVLTCSRFHQIFSRINRKIQLHIAKPNMFNISMLSDLPLSSELFKYIDQYITFNETDDISHITQTGIFTFEYVISHPNIRWAWFKLTKLFHCKIELYPDCPWCWQFLDEIIDSNRLCRLINLFPHKGWCWSRLHYSITDKKEVCELIVKFSDSSWWNWESISSYHPMEKYIPYLVDKFPNKPWNWSQITSLLFTHNSQNLMNLINNHSGYSWNCDFLSMRLPLLFIINHWDIFHVFYYKICLRPDLDYDLARHCQHCPYDLFCSYSIWDNPNMTIDWFLDIIEQKKSHDESNYHLMMDKLFINLTKNSSIIASTI